MFAFAVWVVMTKKLIGRNAPAARKWKERVTEFVRQERSELGSHMLRFTLSPVRE